MPKQKKVVRDAKKGARIQQVAAIPFRMSAEHGIETLVVTSRGTQRFIIPKGWPMKGKTDCQAAAIEAREEAGVLGKPLKEPAGSYSYWKRLSDCFVPVDVTVYLLEVTEELSSWDEGRSRRRAWLSPADAALLIDEPELATLVKNVKAPRTV